MNQHSLSCDQAVFTSVRTAMGEGYRIIAASPGLRADEKQAVTRNSPSHEGLCGSPQTDANEGWPIAAASFYALASGRLCVALSCPAGAEHTGRGGQRIYTHSVVFAADEFVHCAFNPFHVLRAMIAADLHQPCLKPPPVMEEIVLEIDNQYDNMTTPKLHEGLCGPTGCCVLEGVLRDRSQVVHLGGNFLSSTEALLLGLPGPARAKTSFGAGLRFSPSRKRTLHTLHDEKGMTKQRLVGQPVDYTDTTHLQALPANPSAWMTFVARRWKNGDCVKLATETSRAFVDVGAEARERVGRLYNDIDAIPEMATDTLLTVSLERLRTVGNDVEQNIAAEFLAKSGRSLVTKFGNACWTELAPHWQTLVTTWRCVDGQPAFVQPLLAAMLRAAMRDDPMLAAERALVLAQDVPPIVDGPAHTALLDETLNRLAAWVRSHPEADTQSVLALCDQWTSVRHSCPILDCVRQSCTADVGQP